MPRESLLPCESCTLHALTSNRKLIFMCSINMFGDMLFSQSPDVNPIQCPGDAFCPEGSLSPSYCMETFFRKDGDTCELAPVTIALLVIGGGGKSQLPLHYVFLMFQSFFFLHFCSLCDRHWTHSYAFQTDYLLS